MRDRWIPDSSKFHKPINEDSANEDTLFVCGIFLWVLKKWGVIYGRNQEEIHGRSAHGSAIYARFAIDCLEKLSK